MRVETLREFIAVAELRSFSAAAKQLYIAQPTLSAHIIGLEKKLGTVLIDRENGFRLTEPGVVLFDTASRALATLDEGVGIIQAMKKPAQRVRIADSSDLTVLREVLRGLDDVEVELFDADLHAPFFDMLESGRADILVGIDVLGDPHMRQQASAAGIVGVSLGSGEFVLCVSESHPLAARKTLVREDLRNVEMLAGSPAFFNQTKMAIDGLFGSDLGIRIKLAPTLSIFTADYMKFEGECFFGARNSMAKALANRLDIRVFSEIDGKPLLFSMAMYYMPARATDSTMRVVESVAKVAQAASDLEQEPPKRASQK